MTAPTAPVPCRTCRKPVQWARTERNRWIALDPKPNPEGNQAAWQDSDGIWKTRQISPNAGPDDKPWTFEKPYMLHVATCKPAEAPPPPGLPQNVIPISAANRNRNQRLGRPRT